MLNTGDRHKLVPGTGVGECAWRSCRKLRGEPAGYGEAVDLFDEALLRLGVQYLKFDHVHEFAHFAALHDRGTVVWYVVARR